MLKRERDLTNVINTKDKKIIEIQENYIKRIDQLYSTINQEKTKIIDLEANEEKLKIAIEQNNITIEKLKREIDSLTIFQNDENQSEKKKEIISKYAQLCKKYNQLASVIQKLSARPELPSEIQSILKETQALISKELIEPKQKEKQEDCNARDLMEEKEKREQDFKEFQIEYAKSLEKMNELKQINERENTKCNKIAYGMFIEIIKDIFFNDKGLINSYAKIIEEIVKSCIINSEQKYEKISEFIGDKGTSIICRSLKFNPNLRTLNLIDCGIKIEGRITLGNMLENNDSLYAINLGDISYYSAFEKNKVDMKNWNYIEDEGVNAIIKGLENNETLNELYLCNQKATYKSLYKITALLAENGKNKTLKVLDISYNTPTINARSFTGVRKNIKVHFSCPSPQKLKFS